MIAQHLHIITRYSEVIITSFMKKKCSLSEPKDKQKITINLWYMAMDRKHMTLNRKQTLKKKSMERKT